MEQKQHRKESVIHLIYRLVMIIFGAKMRGGSN